MVVLISGIDWFYLTVVVNQLLFKHNKAGIGRSGELPFGAQLSQNAGVVLPCPTRA